MTTPSQHATAVATAIAAFAPGGNQTALASALAAAFAAYDGDIGGLTALARSLQDSVDLYKATVGLFDVTGDVDLVDDLPAVAATGEAWMVTTGPSADRLFLRSGPRWLDLFELLRGGEGKSAYEVWRLQPGNGAGTEADYLDWLANIQVETVTEAVQPLVDAAEASAETASDAADLASAKAVLTAADVATTAGHVTATNAAKLAAEEAAGEAETWAGSVEDAAALASAKAVLTAADAATTAGHVTTTNAAKVAAEEAAGEAEGFAEAASDAADLATAKAALTAADAATTAGHVTATNAAKLAAEEAAGEAEGFAEAATNAADLATAKAVLTAADAATTAGHVTTTNAARLAAQEAQAAAEAARDEAEAIVGADFITRPGGTTASGKVPVFTTGDGSAVEPRPIGAASATDILDRQSGDARYRTEAQVSAAVAAAEQHAIAMAIVFGA